MRSPVERISGLGLGKNGVVRAAVVKTSYCELKCFANRFCFLSIEIRTRKFLYSVFLCITRIYYNLLLFNLKGEPSNAGGIMCI